MFRKNIMTGGLNMAEKNSKPSTKGKNEPKKEALNEEQLKNVTGAGPFFGRNEDKKGKGPEIGPGKGLGKGREGGCEGKRR